MADYYPLLAKAVAGLPNSTPDTRRAIYDRARNALLGQLRRLEPPVPEADVERESGALEVAVARLEAELAPPPEAQTEQVVAPEPPPGPASKVEPTRKAADAPEPPPEIRSVAPVASDEPPAQTPQGAPAAGTPVAESAVPNPAAANIRRRVGAAASPPARPPQFFKVQRERTPGIPPSPTLRVSPSSRPYEAPAPEKPAESPVAPASSGEIPVSPELRFRERSSGDSDSNVREPVAEERPPTLLTTTTDADEAATEMANAASRQNFGQAAGTRLDAQRPFAPRPARDRAAPKRLWIVGFVVGLLVLFVAVAAFELRDRPEDLRQKAATPIIAPDAAVNGKIVDRIGGVGAEPEGTAASATSESAGVSDDQAAKSAAPPAEPPAAVSRRAALLVEAPEEQSKVKTYLGAVVWKVDNVSNGPGEPLSTAVHAEIDIPEEQLRAEMTFQKNFDSTLPASHTMKLQFTEPQGGPLGNVQQISVQQMRREVSATGDGLVGVPVPITENSFLVGLSRGTAEAANLDLIKSREWIDVPMLLSNGKIAKLTFEKGPPGQRALNDALAAWQTQ